MAKLEGFPGGIPRQECRVTAGLDSLSMVAVRSPVPAGGGEEVSREAGRPGRKENGMSGWNGVSRWMPGKDSAWITGLLLAVLVQDCNSERSRADLIRAEFLSGIGETRTATGNVRTELLERIEQNRTELGNARTELLGRIDLNRSDLGSRIDLNRTELFERIDLNRTELVGLLEQNRTELVGRIDQSRSELLDQIEQNRSESAAAHAELLDQIEQNRSESAAARSELLGRIDQLFGAVMEIGENIARMDERQAQAPDPDRDEAQEGTVR